MNDNRISIMTRITRLGLAAAMFIVATGCSRTTKAAIEPKPAEVVCAQPVVKEVVDFEEFTGRIEAVDSIDVRARVTGYLDTANFKDGDEVQKGDVLFSIDPRPYKAALDQAEAQITLADARLKDANADVERNKPLVASGATSKSDFDKLVADRDVAAATVEAARATAETNRLNLNFCKVLAPIKGRISRRLIDPGNLVRADDTVLTRIVSQDPIYAYFDVDERTMLRFRRLIRDGRIRSSRMSPLRVDIALADERGFEDEEGRPRRQGLIDFTDNRVDSTTGTLPVRAKIENPKLTDNVRLLSAGMFVRIRLPVGTPRQALLIPEQALGTDQGQKFVFVIHESQDKGQTVSRVVQRTITVGALHDGLRAIEGLKPGDRVVTSGLQRIRDGAKVNARPEPKRTEQVRTPADDDKARPASANRSSDK